MRRISAVVALFASLAFLTSIPSAVSAGTLPDIEGVWYSGGDHSKVCHIRQSGDSVTMTNEIGQHATGTFTDPGTLSMSWPSPTKPGARVTIVGHIANDLKLIYWDNATYWTR